MKSITLGGEEFCLLASKALYWPVEETLFVADLHLGKAAAFRARSIPLPHGTTETTLNRLSEAIGATKAKRVVVLGDLWHDRLGMTNEIIVRLGEWTSRHPEVEFLLIEGNHDLKSGATPRATGFRTLDEYCVRKICGRHHPEPTIGMFVLAGHIHPGLEVGRAKSGLKLPCFAVSDEVGILPAFGDFTGLAAVRPSDDLTFYVIADAEIFVVSGKALAQVS